MNSIWVRNFALALIAILLFTALKVLYLQRSPSEMILDMCEEYYATGIRPTHIDLPCR